MTAGFRSPCALWLGGASSAPITVQAGYRSAVAPWLGGSSAPTPPAGYRSVVAPWLGGASAGGSVQASVSSLLAFWYGGAAAGEPRASVSSLLAFWYGGAAAGASEPPLETEQQISYPGRKSYRQKALESIAQQMKEAPAAEVPALVKKFRRVFLQQMQVVQKKQASRERIETQKAPGSRVETVATVATVVEQAEQIVVPGLMFNDDELVAISVAVLTLTRH